MKANRGAPGVDGLSIQKVSDLPGSVDGFLSSIHEELKAKTYRPQAVRRVYIPKPDGRKRPLGPAQSAGPTSGANAPGIPTVRDRVVQTAALFVLEPIFEAGRFNARRWSGVIRRADFLNCSWGFRPKRSATPVRAGRTPKGA